MSIMIRSERLAVEIALPGEEPNTTLRFDRAGFVTQVTLDGERTFCTREPDNLAHPCSGGVGLCSEFKADALAREVPVGGQFLKPGVGILTKTEEQDYIFYKRYQAELFRILVDRHPDAVTFVTEPLECNGYALRLTRLVHVEGTELTMTIQAANVGEKELELAEYCHNFVTIDHLPIGPNYRLTFSRIAPQHGKLSPGRNGTFTADRNTFSFAAYNPEAAMAYIAPEDILPGTPFYWELTNTGSPSRLRETDSFRPDAVAIWAIDHIISPEVFHRVMLKPGDMDTWSRNWSFA